MRARNKKIKKPFVPFVFVDATRREIRLDL